MSAGKYAREVQQLKGEMT